MPGPHFPVETNSTILLLVKKPPEWIYTRTTGTSCIYREA
jgi:hypothetical protein